MPNLTPAAAEGLPHDTFFEGAEIDFWGHDGHRTVITLFERNVHIDGAWEAMFYDGLHPRHLTIHECYFDGLEIVSSKRRLSDDDMAMYRAQMGWGAAA